MKTIEVKTNIKCAACVAKVTQTLNDKLGESNWKVDTLHPKKILSVNAENVSKQEVISAVQAAGYKAEELS
jgi:copper chaperone